MRSIRERKIEHQRLQYAVGHGFFHTGSITIADTQHHFEYVYDCGGKKKHDLLFPRVKHYVDSKDDRPIDMLVVSHLHDDHVSGLDRLLLQKKVHTVVLPYINQLERILLVGSKIKCSQAATSIMRLMADPIKWFEDRDVTNVLFVKSRHEQGPAKKPISNEQ